MNKRNKATERLYFSKVNNCGEKYFICEYISTKEIYVKFENNYIVKTTWSNFNKGQIYSPYTKKVYNVGFLGEGKYKTSIKGKMTREYTIWCHMLQRCYSPYYINKFTSYLNCRVEEKWHNFQNFAEWYHQNYYVVDGERTELDKDILTKNNKLYSDQTCCFVPRKINSILIKSDKARGDSPIGVHFCHKASKYIAQVNKYGKRVRLGAFLTEVDAFNEYKKQKELYIKEVINEYKDIIPAKVYMSLLTYIVEIQD